ncbi:MAG: 23S rRNA (adenine(2030)-N(6))-methyltransferase RlmJ [Rhodospirillales bacterium]|nr:23S rRNA (adenine(2030)-N(6))-methyltransferase RlmJ [Rhodospirillales bacterium]
MLSYQHIYHAGGWFDVHKHAVLCALWAQMEEQAAGPLTYVDTHAGRGLYDLTAPEAKKIAEFETGITKLDTGRLPPPFAPYVHAVRSWKPEYPGSAGCIAALKRDDDMMALYELHPGEIKHLQAALGRMPNLTIEQKDGHEEAAARAGGADTLVMIDPSYEVKAEYEQTARTVRAILDKAPETKIMVWYPVLAGGGYHKILLKELGPLTDEALHIVIDAPFPEKPHKGMVQSGLILFNPPEGVEKKSSAISEVLIRILRKKN